MPRKKNVRHDIPAEMSFLGCLFYDADELALGLTLLKPDDFYRSSHALLFRAIGELSQKGVKLDEITLSDFLQATDRLDDIHVRPAKDATQMEAVRGYLWTLMQNVPGPAMMDSYARIIRERAQTRKIIEAADAAMNSAESGLPPAEVAAELEAAISKSGDRDASRISARELMHGLADRIESGQRPEALSSGFADLDSYFQGGLHPGVTVLAGPSGSGKTALLSQWGIRAARAGIKGLWVMEDMNRDKLTLYLACQELGLSEEALWNAEHHESVLGVCSDLASLPYDLYNGDTSLTSLSAAIKAESIRGVRWFMLDSIQHVQVPEAKTEWLAAQAVAKHLQKMAARHNVYVLASCEWKSLDEGGIKQTGKGKRRWPVKSDAYGGGRIAHSTDEFLILWPPQANGTGADGYQGNPEHWLIVDKSRSGPSPKRVIVDFQGAWHRFCLT